MTENPDGGTEGKIRDLELRVEKLEGRVAALMRSAGVRKPATGAAPGAARNYRDSFDALDYPER